MKVIALLAEQVMHEPITGRTTLVRLIDRVSTETLPRSYPSLSLYFEIHCEPEETGRDITIGFRLIDPEGAQIGPNWTEPTQKVPAVTEGRTKLLGEKVFANVPFAKFGPHLVRLLANGECAEQIPLMVARVVP